jgi:Mn2+/Fe2+ NRAMP family transporter
VAAILWYIAVYQSFGVIKKIFLTLSFAFVAYLITGLFSGANWGTVLRGTFIPHLSLGFAGVSSAVALLGATLSPYTMFWQTQGEKEQDRPGTPRQQSRLMATDVASGTFGGNLIAYFIILTTAATLYTHHQTVNSAADAARALVPLLGPFAKYLFALGFIGAGVVAIPVLLASTSYALSGAFGWPASLWRKPWQSEGFYLIITGAMVAGVALALTGLNPIQFIFWANVLQGVLAPVLMVIILLVGNNRAIMAEYRLGKLTNFWLVVAIVVATAATVLLIIGLLTGQGGGP